MTGQSIGVPGARVVPFVNVLALKQATVALGLFAQLLAWERRTRRDPDRVLVIYNAFSFMAGPVLLLSRVAGVTAVAIVADLPPKTPTGLVHKIEARLQTRAVGAFDGLVQITEHIGRDFAPERPTLLVEGGFPEEAALPRTARVRREGGKVVLFSGALDENSGIDHLLRAFARISDPTMRLEIMGKGVRLESVLRAQERDERITYLGYVANDVALRRQQAADVLVCPRLPDGHTTKYSFPSKVMEYLATRNPVVCSDLEGLPQDYWRHLEVPEDTTAGALARSIERATRRAGEGDELAEFIAGKRWERRSLDVLAFLRHLTARRQGRR
jgi:glycosyltransferase involved in cell wall biosynthesis